MRNRIVVFAILMLPFLVVTVAAYRVWRTTAQTSLERTASLAALPNSELAHDIAPPIEAPSDEQRDDSEFKEPRLLDPYAIQASFIKAIRTPANTTSQVTATLKETMGEVDLQQIGELVALHWQTATQLLESADNEEPAASADSEEASSAVESSSITTCPAARSRAGLLRRIFRRR